MANIKNFIFENVFGFQKEKPVKTPLRKQQSFAEPSFSDDAEEVIGDLSTAGQSFAYGTNFGIDFNNEKELINKYRKLALNAEVDTAIDEVLNDIINFDEVENVTINLDEVDLSDAIKDKIRDEHQNIIKLLKFNTFGDELIRQWYIDGRLYHHIIVNDNKKLDGIKELRLIDPREIKKIKEVNKKIDQETGVEVIDSVDEYFTFQKSVESRQGMGLVRTDSTIKVPSHAVSYIHSGLFDEDVNSKKMIISYLHKALKPFNQLDMLESAAVIYRITRAPERRVFYIDIGNLPKTKAEQYMAGIISRYKNKTNYDSTTGTVKNGTDQMSMLEDIWLPRKEGGKGTEVDSLPGGQNLGEMEDILYFRKKMYKSLHIPLSRLESESSFNLGRSSEISRDEIKFSKFIEKLRKKFSQIFYQLLSTQLVLKNILTNADWDKIKDKVSFDFNSDLHFKELKDAEILRERIEMLVSVDEFVGKYFSIDYVQKKILHQTDDEIVEEEDKIKKEKASGKIPSESGEE